VKSKLSPEALKRLAALACRSDDDAPTVVGAMALPVEMFGDYLRHRAKIETDPNVRFDLERIADNVEAVRRALEELVACHTAASADDIDDMDALCIRYSAAWEAAHAVLDQGK
jgi:hypothetical protein